MIYKFLWISKRLIKGKRATEPALDITGDAISMRES